MRVHADFIRFKPLSRETLTDKSRFLKRRQFISSVRISSILRRSVAWIAFFRLFKAVSRSIPT